MSTAPKTWFPTKYQHLYRHKSGTYYARILIGGKKTWRSLKTAVLSVAKEEWDKLIEDAANQKEVSQEGIVAERMTGAQAIEIRKRQLENDASIKKNTRRYWNEIIASLERTWPEFVTAELRRVTEEHCQRWAGKHKEAMSPTRFNNSLSLIRHLFEIAIKRGARRTNPANSLKRAKVRTKDLSSRLPARQKFAEWVKEMRRPNARFSGPCADFVEFLAYSGVRKGEAEWIQWKDCDFARGEILVRGEPEEGTKNSEFRRIPMISACRELLMRLKAKRPNVQPTDGVMRVQEAQKAMDRAASVVGMERITHHDLRHLFATVCIESGVDIPTVAKWLGHKDGGALAMKVYGHLRNEHSLAAATRVSFAA
ncbi:MAG: site-specific integrase [Verrucomicrobiaceae bacterium]|nr:site-specific integrase [Verrucomicrobiaceae bacterium]